MDTSDNKGMLMRKVAIFEFGCRETFYIFNGWVIVYLLPIPEKISRNDMLFWNIKAKILLRKEPARFKLTSCNREAISSELTTDCRVDVKMM